MCDSLKKGWCKDMTTKDAMRGVYERLASRRDGRPVKGVMAGDDMYILWEIFFKAACSGAFTDV